MPLRQEVLLMPSDLPLLHWRPVAHGVSKKCSAASGRKQSPLDHACFLTRGTRLFSLHSCIYNKEQP